MTTTEIRSRLTEIEAETSRLSDEKYRLVLALEEAEGRSDSHAARFARAAVAHDVEAMTLLCAEEQIEHRRKYGPNPIEREVMRLLDHDSPASAVTETNHPGA